MVRRVPRDDAFVIKAMQPWPLRKEPEMTHQWTSRALKPAAIAAVTLAFGAVLISACGGNKPLPLVPTPMDTPSVIACDASGSNGCGGAPTAVPTSDGSGSNSDSASALYKQLLKGKFDSSPKGYGSASFKSQSLDDTDRSNGVAGVVKITFSGSSDYLLVAVYNSIEQTGRGSANFSGQLPAGSSERFLPYLPNADCATGGGRAECSIQEESVLVISVAADMTGASTLIQSGDQLAQSYQGASASSSPTDSPTSSGQADGCSLLTASEAAAALHASSITPRADSFGNCTYQDVFSSNGSIEIQPEDGGASKYDFDHSNIDHPQDLSGIGDKAFAFVSAAGFTEVHILKGSHYVVVNFPGSLSAAEKVAKEVAGRM